MRINTAYTMTLAVSLATSALLAASREATGEEKMQLSDGRFEMSVPEKWQRKQPRVNIIDYEFEVPASDGEANPGRMTVMGAGGSVEDNMNRWYGQFRQPDDSATSKAAKVEKKEIAGQQVTLVDVAGTYLDKPGGPFAGGQTIERPEYRMLAAIVETTKKGKKTGNYFIKLIGPRQTIADNKEAFEKMIDSLKDK
jgi:hypothetical protein